MNFHHWPQTSQSNHRCHRLYRLGPIRHRCRDRNGSFQLHRRVRQHLGCRRYRRRCLHHRSFRRCRGHGSNPHRLVLRRSSCRFRRYQCRDR